MKLKYFLGLIAVGLAVYLVWGMTQQSNQSETNNNNSTGSVQSPENTTRPAIDQEVVVEEVPNAIYGELQESNDSRRGNLMLLLDDEDRLIYFNTSRDYSDLVGEHVQVTIEGSLDDFRLIDIKED